MRKNRLLWNLATLAAFAYLAVMVISGALPEQRQLVKFEAKGLMTLPPERIARVDLVRGDKTVTFVRSGDAGWIREDKGPLPKALAEKLSLAVQIMNTSGPVRVMEATEHRGTDPREFGLDKPRLSITLSEGAAPVLRAHFGGLNPERFLQYMAVEGRPELFLMSLFVGQYWSDIADGAFAK
ncbi:MAG TPA: hypothetical protein VF934_07020 [Burkholderiales bacterium]